MNRASGALKFLSLLLAAVLLAGCAGGVQETAVLFEKPSEAQTEEDVRYIYLTHSADENSFTHQAAGIFKEVLEEKSGGHFAVRIFPNDTFGTVDQADYSLESGSVQMRIGAGPCLLFWLISYRMISGLDIQELNAAMEREELRGLMDRECGDDNVKVMGMLPCSYRYMTCNREVQRAEDLQGLVLRMYDAETPILYWKAQGAEIRIFSFSEVYGAMQSGLVDGTPEVTLQDIISRRLYEHQKYVIDVRQQIYNEPVYVNLDFYNSLTEEERKLLEEAVHEMQTRSEPILEENLREARQVLEKAGVTWITLPEEEQEKIMEKARPVVLPAMEKSAGKELLADLFKVLDRIRADLRD